MLFDMYAQWYRGDQGNTYVAKDKGQWRGSCNRSCCQAPGSAIYWHKEGLNAYYCFVCAFLINDGIPDRIIISSQNDRHPHKLPSLMSNDDVCDATLDDAVIRVGMDRVRRVFRSCETLTAAHNQIRDALKSVLPFHPDSPAIGRLIDRYGLAKCLPYIEENEANEISSGRVALEIIVDFFSADLPGALDKKRFRESVLKSDYLAKKANREESYFWREDFAPAMTESLREEFATIKISDIDLPRGIFVDAQRIAGYVDGKFFRVLASRTTPQSPWVRCDR